MEDKIAILYEEAYVEMSILSREWHQELTRSERLLTEELLDEEIEINIKLSEFQNLFNKNLIFYSLERKRMYVRDKSKGVDIEESVQIAYNMGVKN